MIVQRPRPPVAHVDAALPPTSSFPSGHTCAAICLFGGIAVIVMNTVRAWWRWVVVALAAVLVMTVAAARMYRGAHYLTDAVGAVLLAVPWLLVTAWAVHGAAAVHSTAVRR
jgi:undecaprenyl-diphosphatase